MMGRLNRRGGPQRGEPLPDAVASSTMRATASGVATPSTTLTLKQGLQRFC
jgi:hypothetical protein